jgi:formate-dependent nitrite reductase membrane component NrfD
VSGNEAAVTRAGVEGARPGREAPADFTTRRRRRRGETPMVPEAQFRSYYGQPILNKPVWSSLDIAGYLFLGGLAGAASAIGAAADVRGEDGLARVTKTGAATAAGLSLAALVHDLGKPTRFLNMLRVVKVTSPMNIGAWLLSAYGPAATVAAAADLTGRWRPLGIAATAGAAALGPAVASYTGALISDTAVPAWHDAYREMPFAFVGSAAMAAGGLGLLAAPSDQRQVPRRVAVLGALAEVGFLKTMQRRLGYVAEPYHQGRAGRLMKVGEGLAAAGSASALLGGAWARGRRTADAAAGAMFLAGSAFTRFGIFSAGIASAEDPRYVVQPQRERLRARERRAAEPMEPIEQVAEPIEQVEQVDEPPREKLAEKPALREQSPAPTVDMWQQEDGRWRWRWRSRDGGTTLISHRAFDSLEEAAHSAQEAYPDAMTSATGAAERAPIEHPRLAAAGVVAALVAGVVRRRKR